MAKVCFKCNVRCDVCANVDTCKRYTCEPCKRRDDCFKIADYEEVIERLKTDNPIQIDNPFNLPDWEEWIDDEEEEEEF